MCVNYEIFNLDFLFNACQQSTGARAAFRSPAAAVRRVRLIPGAPGRLAVLGAAGRVKRLDRVDLHDSRKVALLDHSTVPCQNGAPIHFPTDESRCLKVPAHIPTKLQTIVLIL